MVVVALLIVACGLFAYADEETAVAPGNEINVGIWSATPTGNIKANNQASVNMKDDLGFKDLSPLYIDTMFKIGRTTRLGLGYYSLQQNTSKLLTRSITVPSGSGNRTYNVNDTVETNLRLTNVELTWEKNLTRTDTAELNFLLGIKFLSFDGSYRSVTQNVSAGSAFNAPVPQIGLSGKTNLGKNLTLGAYIKWLDIGSGNVRASVSDYAIGLKYNFNPNWAIGVDYKFLHLAGRDGDSNEVTLDHGGPVYMLQYKF
jgi:opacity protein-like surface antigen